MESRIQVSKLIGSASALTVEQGNILYNEIIRLLKKNEKVNIDFSGIESIITPFLNASIGKLYESYTSEKIKNCLKITNQPEGTNRKFNMVIRNAKQFYSNKDAYVDIVEKVLS